MVKNQAKDKIAKIVLVGVLKNRRDLDILLSENWYRIPVKYSPKRQYNYLAFYQPTLFGRQGKRIRYDASWHQGNCPALCFERQKTILS